MYCRPNESIQQCKLDELNAPAVWPALSAAFRSGRSLTEIGAEIWKQQFLYVRFVEIFPNDQPTSGVDERLWTGRQSSSAHSEGLQCGISEVAGAKSESERLRAERFVRSINDGCLNRLLLGESSLRTAVQNFVAHYHSERNHPGLNNRIIQPKPGLATNTGVVHGRERLGGTLNYYYRAAA